MLDFGKTNIFLNYRGGSVISRIINDYDLMGYNCLFLELKPSAQQYSGNIYVKCNTIGYNSYYKVPSILENNLFKVDILIIEISVNYKTILKIIRDVTDIPIILIPPSLKTYSEIFDEKEDLEINFDYIYKLSREERDIFPLGVSSLDLDNMEQLFLKSSYINDIKNNWNMSLLDLRIQYFRDKKINDLLK